LLSKWGSRRLPPGTSCGGCFKPAAGIRQVLGRLRGGRAHAAILLATLLVGSGCGTSARLPAARVGQRRASGAPPTASASAAVDAGRPRLSSLAVASSAAEGGSIGRRYSCAGADISPPLAWSGVDGRAKELAVLVRTIAGGRASTDWAVAGLSPSLTSLRAGSLPVGAVVGRNSSGRVGYSLCPPRRQQALVTIAVYAFRSRVDLRRGFDPSKLTVGLAHSGVQWGAVSARADRAQ
jgi:phosphatidylethanolamine-binding protein (PEBP) family uncharacterized protein